MSLKKLLLAGPLALAISICGLVPAHASQQTFANLNLRDASQGNYTYTNDTAHPLNSGFRTVSVPVFFTYSVANAYEVGSTTPGYVHHQILAHLTFTGFVNRLARVTDLTPPFADPSDPPVLQATQFFRLENLTITADVAGVYGRTNLLTLSNSNGFLQGIEGSETATITGDTSARFTVNYFSDFLNFSPTVNRSYNFGFTGLNPLLGVDVNGYLSSFHASGIGSFASDPSPLPSSAPDGASLALMCGGLLPLAGGGLSRLRRLRAKA